MTSCVLERRRLAERANDGEAVCVCVCEMNAQEAAICFIFVISFSSGGFRGRA